MQFISRAGVPIARRLQPLDKAVDRLGAIGQAVELARVGHDALVDQRLAHRGRV